jgi:hypothetical protein
MTRWVLASEVWAKTKDHGAIVERANRDGSMVDDPPLQLFYCAAEDCPGLPYKASEMAHPPGCGEDSTEIKRSSDSAPYGYPKSVVLAAILAAWVSLCPLAPQQAKREVVIAVDPVYAPVELVSRLRAAEQATRWGFGS